MLRVNSPFLRFDNAKIDVLYEMALDKTQKNASRKDAF